MATTRGTTRRSSTRRKGLRFPGNPTSLPGKLLRWLLMLVLAFIGLSLLQVNGARAIKPLAFSNGPPNGQILTLIGIAEPGLQAGAREATIASAALAHVNGSRVLMQANPARGFVGGAVLDGAGQFAGMIDSSPATTGGPPRNGGQPSFVPAATIRNFLQNAGVDPRQGRSDLTAAKDAIVRVICVRQ